MRLSILCAVTVALAQGACAGDEVDTGTALCTQAAYDSCASEHDCTSMECQRFVAEDFQVCTQSCSAANPCPDEDGTPVPCDASGYCKPAAEHVCRIAPTGLPSTP